MDRSLIDLTSAYLVTVQTFDPQGQILTGIILKCWNSSDKKIGEFLKVSLWNSSAVHFKSADVSRDFKLGEQVILGEDEAGLFETFLPSLKEKFDALFSAEEYERWMVILYDSDHEHIENRFSAFWLGLSREQKRVYATGLGFLLLTPFYRRRLYQVIVNELEASGDKLYYEILRPLFDHAEYFHDETPRAMYLAIDLRKLSEHSRDFRNLLKEFYGLCLENGVSFKKSEEDQIKLALAE